MADRRVSAASLNDLTAAIIAASIAVHRALGPGLLEAAYLSCLCYELQNAGISFEAQNAVPLVYKNVRIDCAYRVDLLVEGCIVVAVKALESLAPIHSRQALTYLRFLGSPVGLILNFGARTMREGIKRVVNASQNTLRKQRTLRKTQTQRPQETAETTWATSKKPGRSRRRPLAGVVRAKRGRDGPR